MWRISAVVQPPENLKAFPKGRRAKRKTWMAGEGKRSRWKDENGTIYEWGYRHGHVEVYDGHGHHRGAFDAESGEQISGAISTRRVEP